MRTSGDCDILPFSIIVGVGGIKISVLKAACEDVLAIGCISVPVKGVDSVAVGCIEGESMVNWISIVVDDSEGMADRVSTGEVFVSPSLPIIEEGGEDIVVSDISVPFDIVVMLGRLLTLVPESVAGDVVWLTIG